MHFLQSLISMDSDPPFHKTYKTLFDKNHQDDKVLDRVEEYDLPFIDVSRLEVSDDQVRDMCKSDIARASKEWGFFQVVNHGISHELLERMRTEQEKLFKQPFDKKREDHKFLNFSAGSYRWGTPTATCLKQLSWSEAFHIPITDIYGSVGLASLRYISMLLLSFPL